MLEKLAPLPIMVALAVLASPVLAKGTTVVQCDEVALAASIFYNQCLEARRDEACWAEFKKHYDHCIEDNGLADERTRK